MGDGADQTERSVKLEKHTIQWRLWLWGMWVQEARTELSQSYSPFGRYAEMQEFSASHADGIVYEIIDGTPCPPDGGLARSVELRAGIIMHNQRCKDVNEAIYWLPPKMAEIVRTTYIVPGKGEPRSTRHVAELLGLSQATVQQALKDAHARLSRRIYGPFEFVSAGEVEDAA